MAGKYSETANDSTRDSMSALNDGVTQIKSDASNLASAVSEDLKHHAQKMGELTKQQATKAIAAAGEQVRSHPTTSLALAVGAGMLVGMMFARR